MTLLTTMQQVVSTVATIVRTLTPVVTRKIDATVAPPICAMPIQNRVGDTARILR